MATPNSSYSEIITTTIQNRSKKLADNVSKNNAILSRLSERGRIQKADGGNVIVQELEHAENSTAMWYSGYEQLSISPSEVISAADFAWKQLAVAVTISGLEQLQNAGESRMINLLRARISNAEKTMSNYLSQGLYAAGTGNGGKEIGGLQHIVADTNTNTVGNIDGSTYTFWKNVSVDLSDSSSTLSTSNVNYWMATTHSQITRGAESPDLILADSTYYNVYLQSLQSIQRITSDKMAKAGFESLRYMKADVVLDGGKGGFCPSSHMYFLNSDYIFFRPHAERNMVALDPDRFSTNQDALVKLIGWAGNMTASNRSLQAVMKA